jgi:uncharacterized repeat protein (TIGR02543 family)
VKKHDKLANDKTSPVEIWAWRKYNNNKVHLFGRGYPMFRKIVVTIIIAMFIVILASCDSLPTGTTAAVTTANLTSSTTANGETTITNLSTTGLVTTTNAATTVITTTTTTITVPTYVVTFDSNGGTVILDLEVGSGGTIVMPAVVKMGYILLGWYASSDFTGSKFTNQTTVQSDITLYAKWSDTKIADGTSTMTAYPILMGEVLTCDISMYDQRIFYEFIPTVSATYDIVSYGSFDPYCWLYNSEVVELDSADTGGSGENFLISEYLEVGQTYYLEVCLLFDDGKVGVFTISINPQPS